MGKGDVFGKNLIPVAVLFEGPFSEDLQTSSVSKSCLFHTDFQELYSLKNVQEWLTFIQHLPVPGISSK
jgi:hypothetical protein